MDDNWLALYLSIIRDYSVDESLRRLKIKGYKKTELFKDEDIVRMLRMRKRGLTIREIAESYGTNYMKVHDLCVGSRGRRLKEKYNL